MIKIFSKIFDIVRQTHTARGPVYSLIFANLISIGFAIYGHWQLAEVILLFWAQNIIIGIFSVYKLYVAKNIIYTGKGISETDKKSLALSFGIPFFIFNLFYLPFFYQFMDLVHTFSIILIPLAVFALSHLISFLINFNKDSLVPIQYKQFTVAVFIRIFPIHFFIIFGGALIALSYMGLVALWMLTGYGIGNEQIIITCALVLFMLFKTFFEVVAHIISHADPTVLDKYSLAVNTTKNRT